MKNWLSSIPSLAIFSALSMSAQAAVVPEMDGSSAAIALGLTVGIVALIKETRGRK